MAEPMRYESIQSAAERLSVCERTIRRAIARGDLPAYRMGKSSRLIRLRTDDVERLMRPIPSARSR